MTPLLSDSVPLFLFHEESFLLYIIDSELFSCYSPHHWAYYGYRGLSLLATLFSSSKHTVPVPELFHEFFKHHTFPTDFDEVNDFVIGGIGYCGFPSLDFQLLHNDEKGANDILLHSFQIDDGPLSSFDVSVSQKDAFLILGNHCINKRRGRLLYDHPTQTVNYMALTLKTKTEKAKYTKESPRTLIDQFSVLYSNYIVEQLSNNEISLPYLLSRNGAGMLSLLRDHPLQDYVQKLLVSALDISSLSLLQQAQLFAVIRLYEYDELVIENPVPEFVQFVTAKKEIIRTLVSNFSRNLPDKKSFFFCY
ncbi:MAG: hypothetical protein ACTSQN_18105 [Candidatus Heimdallarchaeota archaeon]